MKCIKKYRKKPVVVEAYQTDKVMYIETLEGIHKANVGDYIITGVRGEQYPCKPDIFEETYEEVSMEASQLEQLHKTAQRCGICAEEMGRLLVKGTLEMLKDKACTDCEQALKEMED